MTTRRSIFGQPNYGGSDMQRLRHSRDLERGQVLIIAAGGLITLMMLVGLVLDGGVAIFNRRDAQDTSDIMALAGTRFVADVHRNEAQVDPTITTTFEALTRSATANDCVALGASPCTWQAWFVVRSATGPVDSSSVVAASTVPANALGVRVAVTRNPRTFVVAIVGISSWTVSAQATAIAERGTTAPAGQLLPIAFKGDPTTAYNPGQVYDLTDGKDAPGGFGYISWSGSNDANTLANSLCTADNPEFSLPHTFPGDPGKTNASDVRACLAKLITSGQTVLIPIYSTTTGNGNGAVYTIIGVAAFVITSSEQPAVDNIRGYFVEIYMANPIPGGGGALPPGPADTSFSLALVR
jgi:hypothetical protein